MDPFDGMNGMDNMAGMGPMSMNNDLSAAAMRMQALNTNSMQDISSELGSTMRSFKDSMAFSFQTLNMTLTSLHHSMTNLGTKISNMSSGGMNDVNSGMLPGNWMPAGAPNLYLGSMPSQYAQLTGNMSFTQLLSRNILPYNQSPLMYWSERNRDLTLRSASLAGSVMAGAASGALSLASWTLGLPMALGVGFASDMILDPMVQYAKQRNADIASVERMSARFRSPFTLREAQRTMTGVENLAYQELFNTTLQSQRMNLSGFRDVMNIGLQANLFHGTTPDQLVEQVKSASNVVKFLAGVMGSADVKEAMELMAQLKNMGVNPVQMGRYVKELGIDAMKYGRLEGIQPDQLVNAAANMSTAAYGQYGLPAFVGLQGGIRNIAYAMELEKRGVLTPAEIAVGGGTEAISGRMTAAGASMLASPTIGQVMLGAGFNGRNGVNLGAMQQVTRGGNYWDTLSMATHNVLSGGPLGMVRFFVNQAEMAASIAEQGGDVSEEVMQVLKQQIEALGMMDTFTGDSESKRDMATFLIMQALPGTDVATAKALATRMYMPHIERSMQAGASAQQRMAVAEMISGQHGIGRFGQSIYEAAQRFGSSIYQNVIVEPARRINDSLANTFNQSYENSDMFSIMPTENLIRNAIWGETAAQSSYGPMATFTADDFVKAYNMNTNMDPDSFWHAIMRTGNAIDTFTGNKGNINALEDVIGASQASDFSSMWKRINDPLHRRSKVDSMLASGGVLGDLTIQDVTRIFEEYKDNPTAVSPIQAVGEAMNRGGKFNFADEAARVQREMLAAITGKTVEDITNMSQDDRNVLMENLLSEVLGPDMTVEFQKLRGTTGTTADTLYTFLNQPGVMKNLKQVAGKYGGNVDTLRGQLALYAGNDYIFDKRNNNLAFISATGNRKRAEAIAEGFASEMNADKYSLAEDIANGGYSFQIDQRQRLLDSLGISSELFAELNPEDFKGIIAAVRQVETNGNLSAEDIKKVIENNPPSTTAGKKIMDSIMSKGKPGMYKAMQDFLGSKEFIKYAGGEYNAETGEWEGGNDTLNGQHVDVASILEGVLGDKSKFLARASLKRALGSMGAGDLTEEQVDAFINAAKVGDTGKADLEKGLRTLSWIGTSEGDNLSAQAHRFKSMSIEDLNRELGNGQYGFSKITEENRTDVINRYIEQAIKGVQQKEETSAATEAKAMRNKETAIDTAVETNAARPYVLVQTAGAWAKDERELIGAEAFYNKYGVKGYRLLPEDTKKFDQEMKFITKSVADSISLRSK